MTYTVESSLTSVTHDGMIRGHVANGHVIGDDYLLGFVQGTLDSAEALLVATQYRIAPETVTRVKILAECAAASFENAKPQTMRCSAQAFFEERCTSSREERKNTPKKHCAVPEPLQAFVGETYCDISWTTLFPRVEEKVLSIKGSQLHACLFKMAKGASVPVHTHQGDAAVLVLCGSFADRGAVYQKGDVIFFTANPDVTHNPEAIEDCICFGVFHAPLKFKSLWQHLFYRVRRGIARCRG